MLWCYPYNLLLWLICDFESFEMMQIIWKFCGKQFNFIFNDLVFFMI